MPSKRPKVPRPSLFPNPAIVAALVNAAEAESKLRGVPVTWQDVARSVLAQTFGIQDTMPGGLDVDRLRRALALAPLTFDGVENEGTIGKKRGKRATV